MVFYLCAAVAAPATAQALPEPNRDQLLNGLHVILWQRPGDQNVLVKLRVHSGAAFDLAGKSGLMALLGDALFPDPATREYVTEELRGRLEVITDYDSINITISGRAGELERIIELLRNALVETALTTENVAKLRDARIKLLREMTISPAMIADRAVAARLLGEFPYGRPSAGSAETLARIERADLLLARQRFLNPDNATLVIVGAFDEHRALRGIRQLLGSWRKSDQIVPPTFRQPDVPDTRPLVINQPGEGAEVRIAVRGLARSDGDYPAAALLAVVAQERWQSALRELSKGSFFVRHEAHSLPGVFVLGASVQTSTAAKTISAARKVVQSVISSPPSPAELERAKSEVLAALNGQASQPDLAVRQLLDSETFKLGPFAQQVASVQSASAADVQRAAIKIFKNAPVATVVVGSYDQLESLGSLGPVELLGDQPPPKPTAVSAPVKKP